MRDAVKRRQYIYRKATNIVNDLYCATYKKRHFMRRFCIYNHLLLRYKHKFESSHLATASQSSLSKISACESK